MSPIPAGARGRDPRGRARPRGALPNDAAVARHAHRRRGRRRPPPPPMDSKSATARVRLLLDDRPRLVRAVLDQLEVVQQIVARVLVVEGINARLLRFFYRRRAFVARVGPSALENVSESLPFPLAGSRATFWKQLEGAGRGLGTGGRVFHGSGAGTRPGGRTAASARNEAAP